MTDKLERVARAMCRTYGLDPDGLSGKPTDNDWEPCLQWELQIEAAQAAVAECERWLLVDDEMPEKLKHGTRFLGGWQFQHKWKSAVCFFAPDGKMRIWPGRQLHDATHYREITAPEVSDAE